MVPRKASGCAIHRKRSRYLKAKKQQFFDSSDVASSETVRGCYPFGFESRMVSGGNQRSFFRTPEE
jgi:hypothetical protein